MRIRLLVILLLASASSTSFARDGSFRRPAAEMSSTSSDVQIWTRPRPPPDYVPPEGQGYGVPLPMPTPESIVLDLVATVQMMHALDIAGVKRQRGEIAVQIVPTGHPAAVRSRQILAHFGIGLMTTDNAIYLPLLTDSTNTGTSSRYDNHYFRNLETRLKSAQSREEVLVALQRAAQDLRNR
jgi:hypothetical protein